ncbi:hypothetical protein GE09DRAFT_316316 [Coniochaeta sp. 2T2.1]|nr:hypothetical protein GE09DRAFT_316316 [Coniochaeta sp. 2T2.1]
MRGFESRSSHFCIFPLFCLWLPPLSLWIKDHTQHAHTAWVKVSNSRASNRRQPCFLIPPFHSFHLFHVDSDQLEATRMANPVFERNKRRLRPNSRTTSRRRAKGKHTACRTFFNLGLIRPVRVPVCPTRSLSTCTNRITNPSEP